MAKQSNKNLDNQITFFVESLRNYNNLLPAEKGRLAQDYVFLKNFYKTFIQDRDKRADTVVSEDYKKALEIVKKQFPMMTLWVLCMDGRVKAIHTNGATAGVGSSIRIPAGTLKEFARGENGKLHLIENSYFTMLLDNAFTKFDEITEVFDSHIGCAARKAEESAHGASALDSGLYSDVIHKKEMAVATKEYVNTKYKNRKKIVIVQTSFDPHTGYMYMGLETDKALKYAANNYSSEFVPECLTDLENNQLIVSTKKFTNDTKISKVLKKFYFTIDWKKDYTKSASLFWENISRLKPILLPQLKKDLTQIYPNLSNKENQKELKERAMLLLTNLYNAYLHNTGDPKESSKTNSSFLAHYRYGEHEEEGIKVSEGGYPPYEISMFVINNGNIPTLPEDIELASSLVRSNRREGRAKDRWKLYKDKAAFAKAPVPIVVQEIIRDDRLTESDWKELEKVDWSDLYTIPWDKMTNLEFDLYLERKGKLTQSQANAIKKIRRMMITLYDRHEVTSGHLINQYKTVLGVICDQNRKTHAIIPFVKFGLS